MYNHNKAQQSKNRVHVSWDILYTAYVVQNQETKVKTQWSLSELVTNATEISVDKAKKKKK